MSGRAGARNGCHGGAASDKLGRRRWVRALPDPIDRSAPVRIAIPDPAAAPRHRIYAALFERNRAGAAAWFDGFAAELPFHLGESAADARVPYAFSEDVWTAFAGATLEIGELIGRRQEPTPEPSGAIDLAAIGRRPLEPPRHTSHLFNQDTPVARAVARCLAYDALLDAALMEAWLLRGGAGGPLLARLAALFAHAFRAQIDSGETAPYPYVAALAVAQAADAPKLPPRQVGLRRLAHERAERAVGLAIFAIAESAADEAVTQTRAKHPSAGLDPLVARLTAALNPLAFMGVRDRALASDLNPWGVPAGFATTLDALWAESIAAAPSVERAARQVRESVAADRELGDRSARVGAVRSARRAAFAFLGAFPDLPRALAESLSSAVASDEVLARLLGEPKPTTTEVTRYRKDFARRPEADAACAALLDALKGGLDRRDRVDEAVSAYLGFALDRLAAAHLDQGRGRLRDRRAEAGADLLREYESGRLYRLADDGRPPIRAARRTTQAHLFVDLKGFTQRTARLKEVVVADFLRTEFYQPILRAAQEHGPDPLGASGVQLQNLLGDAAVFSGDVVALMDLARSIQQVLADYGRKLSAREPPADLERLRARRSEAESRLRTERERTRTGRAAVEAEVARKQALAADSREQVLWEMFAHRRSELAAQAAEASARGDAADGERLRQAAELMQRRERETCGRVEACQGRAREALVRDLVSAPERTKLAQLEAAASAATEAAAAAARAVEDAELGARGFGLESGLFISFGAAAERVVLRDADFGEVSVAIAEKINEAARGTARNAAVRAQLESRLDRARASGQGQRRYPFRVTVGSAWQFVLGAELNAEFDRALRDGGDERAREAARRLADAAVLDLARAQGRGDGRPAEMLSMLNDLYNVGEALSGEALEAYVLATAGTRVAIRRTFPVSALPPDFQDAFLFEAERLSLLVSVPQDLDPMDARVFRLAGRVKFRGFEATAGTEVYELLRPDSEFARLFVRLVLPSWIVETAWPAR